MRNFSDLYRLTAESLSDLDGFGAKKTANLLSAIEKSKRVALDAFIYAIGIDGIGRVAAKDLAKRFGSMEALKNAGVEELVALENIGEITAKNIVDYFRDPVNLSELEALFSLGVTPETADESPKEGIFPDSRWCSPAPFPPISAARRRNSSNPWAGSARVP